MAKVARTARAPIATQGGGAITQSGRVGGQICTADARSSGDGSSQTPTVGGGTSCWATRGPTVR